MKVKINGKYYELTLKDLLRIKIKSVFLVKHILHMASPQGEHKELILYKQSNDEEYLFKEVITVAPHKIYGYNGCPNHFNYCLCHNDFYRHVERYFRNPNGNGFNIYISRLYNNHMYKRMIKNFENHISKRPEIDYSDNEYYDAYCWQLEYLRYLKAFKYLKIKP